MGFPLYLEVLPRCLVVTGNMCTLRSNPSKRQWKEWGGVWDPKRRGYRFSRKHKADIELWFEDESEYHKKKAWDAVITAPVFGTVQIAGNIWLLKENSLDQKPCPYRGTKRVRLVRITNIKRRWVEYKSLVIDGDGAAYTAITEYDFPLTVGEYMGIVPLPPPGACEMCLAIQYKHCPKHGWKRAFGGDHCEFCDAILRHKLYNIPCPRCNHRN